MPTNSVTTNFPQSVDTSLYQCPACEKVVDYGGYSVCCDTCDQWFHFACVNLDSNDADNIESQDYICHLCKDNVLHITKQKSPKLKKPHPKAVKIMQTPRLHYC